MVVNHQTAGVELLSHAEEDRTSYLISKCISYLAYLTKVKYYTGKASNRIPCADFPISHKHRHKEDKF